MSRITATPYLSKFFLMILFVFAVNENVNAEDKLDEIIFAELISDSTTRTPTHVALANTISLFDKDGRFQSAMDVESESSGDGTKITLRYDSNTFGIEGVLIKINALFNPSKRNKIFIFSYSVSRLLPLGGGGGVGLGSLPTSSQDWGENEELPLVQDTVL